MVVIDLHVLNNMIGIFQLISLLLFVFISKRIDFRCVTECVIGRYCEHVREYAAESRHDPKAVAIFQRILSRRRRRSIEIDSDSDTNDNNDESQSDNSTISKIIDDETTRKRRRTTSMTTTEKRAMIVLDDKLREEARVVELARQCTDCLPPVGQFGFVGRPQWCRW